MIDTVPDILARIVAKKRDDLSRGGQPVLQWEEAAELRLGGRRDFRGALAARTPAIIAEVKKASPSKGVLAQDFDPVRIARAYQEGGAAALSVLTDEAFFQGSLNDLERARAAVTMPGAAQGFYDRPVQILEAAAHGADAILLIAAILDEREIRDFREAGGALRHERAGGGAQPPGAGLRRSRRGRDIIGVNNRNLSDVSR